MQVKEISVQELKKLLVEKTDFVLLDCRTRTENEIARIGGEVFIPVHELVHRISELDKKKPIVVYCHHGARSMFAAAMLLHSGFKAQSLCGGIDAWSAEIDNSVPRY
ncbi:MAG: rhodanese [Candidatus Diapherotrites archaeon]|nr:rhodanese [Candidatus Diapherotrites archaeon]